MLIKILPILLIIATYYQIQCLEPRDSKKKHYKSPALPNAYEVMNNYDSEYDYLSTPSSILDTIAELMAIQYAPLKNTDSNNHKHTHAPKRTEAPTTKHYLNKYIQHKPKELQEKDYLQPQWSSVPTIERQQKPRSFFSPHDVSELESNPKVETHDLYRTYHNHVDQTKIRNDVYTSFQNPSHGTPEEELLPDGRTVLYFPGSGQITQLKEKQYVRKVVPFVLTKPFLQGAFARHQGALQKPSGPSKLPKVRTEKPVQALQALQALSPGLHLNLARVYGIAHINDQRHIDVPHLMEKPPIMNRKSVDKKKIVLHPLP